MPLPKISYKPRGDQIQGVPRRQSPGDAGLQEWLGSGVEAGSGGLVAGSGEVLEERSGLESGCVGGTCVALMFCIPTEAA